MKKTKIILLGLFLLFLSKFYGQDTTSVTGIPVTVTQDFPVSWVYLDTVYSYTDSSQVFKPGSNFRTSLSAYGLPYHSNTVLKNYADSVSNSCKTCGFSKYYGYGMEGTINLKSSAQYYNPHIAGGKLWIMHMNSQTALGLQFYFSKFMIPTNSFMHIYTADRKILKGPYTSDNTPADSTKAIHFGTVPVFSKDVYIEYYESDSANYTGNIEFSNVIHIFTTSFGSASDHCDQDVPCSSASGLLNSEIGSVALVLIYTQTNPNNDPTHLAGTCSGNLLNDVQNDEKPYFLTAGHCLYVPGDSAAYDPTTWHFVFDYQNLCCGDATDPNATDPGWTKVVYGASQVLSHDTMKPCGTDQNLYGKSDYLLLLLNSPPLLSYADWGVCFAGWETADPTTASGFTSSEVFTLIHHPSGDVMKISEGDSLSYPIDKPPSCRADETLTWPNSCFYTVDFGGLGSGAPEPGSSGAGLFNSQGRIVATVTGSNDDDIETCLSSAVQTSFDDSGHVQQDYYYFARFNKQFPNFTHTVGGVVQNYLDPTGEVKAGTITGVSTHCTTGGPKLAKCTSSGNGSGGGGGNPYYGNNICNEGVGQGIKVNHLSGLPVLCPADIISFEGLYSDFWLISNSSQSTSCANYEALTSGNPSKETAFTTPCQSIICTSCKEFKSSVEIDIVELDFNLNPVGTLHKKVYSIDDYLAGSFDYQSICTQYVYGFQYFKFSVNNVTNGGSLQPGHFYSLGISSNCQFNAAGTVPEWQNSSRIVYILPNSYSSNNTILGNQIDSSDIKDIYATTDILLENTTVLSNINEVAAGNSIDIQGTSGNSDLEGGHYFINAVNCNTSHRNADPNNNPPKSLGTVAPPPPIKNTYIQSTPPITSQNNKNAAKSFLIYPNPANNNIVVEFTGRAPKVNSSASIIIYNSIGEIVKTENRTVFQQQMGVEVDLLPPGMYNIIVTQGGQTWQSKFVKQ